MGGFFGDGRGNRTKAQELAALGSQDFGGAGEKAEVADSDKPARKNMKQEAADEFLDWDAANSWALVLIPLPSPKNPPTSSGSN